MNRYLDISNEVKNALSNNVPVVALESTIISHGMPYPQNLDTDKAKPRTKQRFRWTKQDQEFLPHWY